MNQPTLDSSCPLNQCKNDGQCSTRLNGNYYCSCLPGYDGINCENGFIFILFDFIFDYIFYSVITCPPISLGNANFSTTLAENIALGKCDDLYYGSPTLYCNLTGYWNQTITGNPCSGFFFP